MEAQGREAVGVDRKAAWCRLAALLLGIVACLIVAGSKDPNPMLFLMPGGMTDLRLFRLVVTRVQAGDSFHEATQQEFRTYGYPTRSVFNWRTPFYAWWLGRVTGVEPGRWLLMAGVLLAVLLASRDMFDDCGIAASGGVVSLVGAMAWCVGKETVFFTELWAGMLIVLSLCALRRGWTAVGVGLGLTAVFYRELALPYALVALCLAAWNGKRREALGWLVGLVLFVVFMAGHAALVHSRLTAIDAAIEGGWVRFGGVRFLLATTRLNVFVISAWTAAFFLPLACLGLASVSSRGGTGPLIGLTAAVYLVAFSVVGNSFNDYWGLMTAPLLALGVGYAPTALWRLLVAAFPRDRPGVSTLEATAPAS